MNKEEIRQQIAHLETSLENPNLSSEQRTNIENELYRLREVEKNIFAQELELAGKKQSSQTSGVFAGITGLPLAYFLREKPAIIEDEKEYQKIAKGLTKSFEKQDGKEFSDYLYGSLDNPNASSLHQDTMNQIKKYNALYEAYEKDKENPELKKYKNYKKYRDLITKYSKKDKVVHKKPQDDPVVKKTKSKIDEEIQRRFGQTKNYPNVHHYTETILKSKRWKEFIERYPEKAKVYAEQDANIKSAYEKWIAEQKLTSIGASSAENDLHRPTDITQQEAEQRIAAATKQGETHLASSANKFGLVGPTGRPLASVQNQPAPSQKQEERKPQVDILQQADRFNRLKKWWSKGGKESVKNLTTDTRGFVSKGFSRTSTRFVNVGNRLFSFGGRLGGLFGGGGAGGGAVAGGATVGGGAAAATGGAAVTGVAVTGGGTAAAGVGISAPVWGAIAIIIAVLLILIIVVLRLTGEPGSIPIGGGGISGNCPTQTEITANRTTVPGACKYLNPSIDIFGDLTQAQIQKYIDTYAKTSDRTDFAERTNQIVQKARSVGLNPAIFLGYWKSEGNFSYSFGCDPTHAPYTFEAELDCALGLSAGGGSTSSRCARSVVEKDPTKKAELEKACEALKKIRQNPIYKNYPVSLPIKTFDDFVETYGSATPELGDAPINYNCINTYNTLLEVALNIGACSSNGSYDMSSCKFIKSGEARPYTSKKLLNYFLEVSQKTGIPASVLAALVRVESTTKDYTISDYTDYDIGIIENSLKLLESNIDAKISGSTKSICPASSTGALGLTQVQPPASILEKIKKQRPDINPAAHSAEGIRLGASFTSNKSYDQLTLEDYCDPKTSLYLGAGVILNKLGAAAWNTNWNNQEKMRELGKLYYGAPTYQDDKGNTYYYGDDLWYGFNNCKSQNLCSQTTPLFVLDPGHDSNDTDHEGKTEEANLNLTIANKTKLLLEKKGILVKLTHNGSLQNFGSGEAARYQSLQNRNDIINQFANAGALGFISIHFDQDMGIKVNFDKNPITQPGPRAYYNDQRSSISSEAKKLAEFVSSAISVKTNTSTNGKIGSNDIDLDIYTADIIGTPLYILGPTNAKTNPASSLSIIKEGTKIPGILSEYFTYGRKYSDIINDFPFTDKIAAGYCDGILRYLTEDPKASCSDSKEYNFKKNCKPKKGNFVYYCQGDGKWANACSMAYAGCGPTAMAMVLATFGENITPFETDQIFINRGWRICGDYPSAMEAAIQQLLPQRGFVVKQLTLRSSLNIKEAKEYLDNGYLIIGSVSDHIFVVDSADVSKNTVHLRDPDTSCAYPNGYDSPADRPWNGESWYYAYAVKKM